jgi:hypothetical protein
MADITKCSNGTCPIKHTCYRWTAPADPLWQSYARFEPTITGTCFHRIPVKDSE